MKQLEIINKLDDLYRESFTLSRRLIEVKKQIKETSDKCKHTYPNGTSSVHQFSDNVAYCTICFEEFKK
jgi:hypothetical protein